MLFSRRSVMAGLSLRLLAPAALKKYFLTGFNFMPLRSPEHDKDIKTNHIPVVLRKFTFVQIPPAVTGNSLVPGR